MNTYSPITNPSFIGREYTQNDEVVEYELNGFHCLSPTESRKLKNYAMSLEETDEEYEKSIFDGEEDDDEYVCHVRVAEAVQHALCLQRFFARQRAARKAVAPAPVKIPEVMEADEVVRYSFRPARKRLQTSTYRPSRNARKPFIGCRTLHTDYSDDNRLELRLVAVDIYDARGTSRRVRIG